MASSSSSHTEEDIEISTLRLSKRGKRSARAALFEDVETDSLDDTEERGHRGKAPLRGGRGGRRGGRRAGRRGDRVLRGRKFDAGAEERPVQLHQERQQQANVMIDQMTEEVAKALIKEIAARQPALILQVSELLSRWQQQEPEPDPESATQSPSWCVCTRCPHRDRVEDQVCCGMAPQ